MTSHHENTVGRALRHAEKWILHHPEALQLTRPVRPYLLPLLAGYDEVRILDAGTGILPSVGTQHPTVRVHLTSCDLYADEFRALLARLRLVPGPEEYVERPDLTALTYPDDTFDIVHCANALDHTVDPFAGIREFVRVCKPGGIVYLRHVRNVGKLERYTALHQWNIDPADDGDCLFWNPAARFRLSACMPGFSTRMEPKVEGLEWTSRVVSVFTKERT
jgi:SAM-dependent methyltransferase